MLGELRGSALLDGFRGAPAVDRATLAKIIAAIGNAALALGPDLVSLEINPLLAFDGGIDALDRLTVWEDAHEQHCGKSRTHSPPRRSRRISRSSGTAGRRTRTGRAYGARASTHRSRPRHHLAPADHSNT